MPNVSHKNLTTTQLHEPKGADAAAADKVYISDGAGSGAWAKIGVNQTTGLPGSRTLLSAQTASTSSAINFAALFSATYDIYEFLLTDIVPSADGDQIKMQIGTGGGPTYETGASAYAYAMMYATTTPASGNLGSTASSYIPLTRSGANGIGTATGETCGALVRCYNPLSAKYTRFWVESTYIDSGTLGTSVWGSGFTNSNTAISAVRFTMVSGNFSGKLFMFGVRLT